MKYVKEEGCAKHNPLTHKVCFCILSHLRIPSNIAVFQYHTHPYAKLVLLDVLLAMLASVDVMPPYFDPEGLGVRSPLPVLLSHSLATAAGA
jgi:hypothetical protein